MTSIPSPGEVLRALLPAGLRDGEIALPFAQGDAPMEADGDGPPRLPGPLWRGGEHPGVGPPPHAQAHSHAPVRSDGLPPMSVPDATRLADSLAELVRQNPSHPLFREVTTTPPEVFRQWVVQALTRQLSTAQDVPAQAMASARDAVPSPVAAEARAQSDALRAAVQAQAQSQAHNQPQQAPPHAAAAERLLAGTGDEARMPLPGAPARADGRSANEAPAGLAHALAQGQRADIAPGPPTLPAGATTLATTPDARAPAGDAARTPAGAGQAAAESTRPADTLMPAPQVRTPNEGVMLPARAERAGGGDPLGGLPGMTAAAGITLAAVASPAGTTFAHAPQEALRARQPEAGRAKDGQRDGEEASDETASEADARRRGDGDGSDANRGSGGPAADAAEDKSTHSAPAAAGHTVAAAGLGLALADDGNEDSDLRLPGHAVDRSVDDGRAPGDPRQWLYWSLIAVTYACLALALATVSPLAPSLPLATEALPAWRTGLTATGLVTGFWAWLLARRMR